MASTNELIYDVMELMRGHQISDDTELSERQILYHINNQRALWIRNEYNKPGRTIDSQIEQDLGCLKIVEADAADCCEVTSGCVVLRTEKKIPNLIELHSGPALTRVGPVHKLNIPFSFTNYQKALYSTENKYGAKAVYAFLLNNYIYLIIKDPALLMIDYINVRGVFANPQDLEDFRCEDSSNCFSYDEEYPINNWMIPYIKEQVLNQFGIALQIPKDTANDADEKLEKQ